MTGQSRVVNFFVEPESLPVVVQAIEDQVLPRFAALPNFVGLVCLKSQSGGRAEVVGISLWSGDLEPSEEFSEAMRDGVSQLTGTILPAKATRSCGHTCSTPTGWSASTCRDGCFRARGLTARGPWTPPSAAWRRAAGSV